MSSKTAAPRVAIVVRDQAVAASLLSLVLACGVEALTPSTPDDLLGAAFLLVDHALGDCYGLGLVERLRTLGWAGQTVLLIEDAHGEGARLPELHRTVVLEKPFAAAQVMAAIGAAPPR